MMDGESVKEEYIKDRRAMSFAGYKREDLGDLVRQTPCEGKGGGWVYFPQFDEWDADRIIEEQIEFFRDAGLEFEWKVYDFDQPDSIAQKLVQHGFSQGEPEHLMVFDLEKTPSRSFALHEGIRIEAVQGKEDFQSMRRLQEEIWDRDLAWLFDYIAGNSDVFSCYVAREGDEVVGSGWVEYSPGSQFPELHGGAVIPRLRQKGIYSALLATRLKEAASKGHRFLSVDAAPMSKPILERKGFVSLAVTWPYSFGAGD